jgi:hypothetical protein
MNELDISKEVVKEKIDNKSYLAVILTLVSIISFVSNNFPLGFLLALVAVIFGQISYIRDNLGTSDETHFLLTPALFVSWGIISLPLVFLLIWSLGNMLLNVMTFSFS